MLESVPVLLHLVGLDDCHVVGEMESSLDEMVPYTAGSGTWCYSGVDTQPRGLLEMPWMEACGRVRNRRVVVVVAGWVWGALCAGCACVGSGGET